MIKNRLMQEAFAAGDARLEGRITREQHAVIIARIGQEMVAAGLTWEDLA